MVKSDLILFSQNTAGQRIATWVLTYPLPIHAELMTHRAFSRNSASARAIRTATIAEEVISNPALPAFFGQNQKGMDCVTELPEPQREACAAIIREHAATSAQAALKLSDLGMHKKNATAMMDGVRHITTIVTTTDFDNFFFQRAHPAAEPTMQLLAYSMLDEFINKTPRVLFDGEWHIPFGDHMPEAVSDMERLRIATGRIARVSYNRHDGTSSPYEDARLHDDLLRDRHPSPFEHSAMAAPNVRSRNFYGWMQYREIVEGVSPAPKPNLSAILDAAPTWIRDRLGSTANRQSII